MNERIDCSEVWIDMARLIVGPGRILELMNQASKLKGALQTDYEQNETTLNCSLRVVCRRMWTYLSVTIK